MFIASLHAILNNYLVISLTKMKDTKNCDAAVSHFSSIRDYSDPESRGGAMLFPGEDHVIPAVLHHEAVPGQAEQRRNRNPEDGGQNEQRRRPEDDTLQDDSKSERAIR